MSDAKSILLVDDDDVFRERLAKAFRELGFEVRCAKNVDDALALARQEPPEYAVVDLRMPGPSGLHFIEAMHALEPATRMVMLTGWGSVPTAVEALHKGATHYLQKPVSLEKLLSVLVPDDDSVSALPNHKGVPVDDDPSLPSLARQEWEYIQRVLADCDDNISEAARRLGLHRRSLQRKLQKHPPAR
jgi:two-component system response regulator RegA